MCKHLLYKKEDWSKEAIEAFSTEVQDQALLMNVEYHLMGQVSLQGEAGSVYFLLMRT